MRVTKLIREYVEKTVKAIPQFANKSEEELALENLETKIIDFKENTAIEIENLVNARIAEFREENNIPEDVEIKFQTSFYPIYSSVWNSKIKTKAEAKKNARATARVKAIEDILVALELGGTKAELDEMLRKLAE
jgi:hypothetical protein